jgi:alpha-beta hydrolase superfamily lysophospholipase
MLRSSPMATLENAELSDGFAELDEVRLHYVEVGDGPLVVLLHGFPEFWFGWRLQIPALAAAGFRVVAPDLRGYNLSSRPEGVAAYDTDKMAADVRDLIRERGARGSRLGGRRGMGNGDEPSGGHRAAGHPQCGSSAPDAPRPTTAASAR